MLGLSASTSSSIGCGATATGASTSATSTDGAGDSTMSGMRKLKSWGPVHGAIEGFTASLKDRPFVTL